MCLSIDDEKTLFIFFFFPSEIVPITCRKLHTSRFKEKENMKIYEAKMVILSGTKNVVCALHMERRYSFMVAKWGFTCTCMAVNGRQ